MKGLYYLPLTQYPMWHTCRRIISRKRFIGFQSNSIYRFGRTHRYTIIRSKALQTSLYRFFEIKSFMSTKTELQVWKWESVHCISFWHIRSFIHHFCEVGTLYHSLLYTCAMCACEISWKICEWSSWTVVYRKRNINRMNSHFISNCSWKLLIR